MQNWETQRKIYFSVSTSNQRTPGWVSGTRYPNSFFLKILPDPAHLPTCTSFPHQLYSINNCPFFPVNSPAVVVSLLSCFFAWAPFLCQLYLPAHQPTYKIIRIFYCSLNYYILDYLILFSSCLKLTWLTRIRLLCGLKRRDLQLDMSKVRKSCVLSTDPLRTAVK